MNKKIEKWNRKQLRKTLRRYSKLPDKCYFCLTKYNIEVHHILPSSQGGSDEWTNLSWLCLKCHDNIHSNDPYNKKDYEREFMKRINEKIKMKFINERGDPLERRKEMARLAKEAWEIK